MIEIRTSCAEEVAQQKDLWKKCFGDPRSYIDLFYGMVGKPEEVLVVTEDGDLNSMAAMLQTTLNFPDGTSAPVGYVYALATNPYIQGNGYARQLLKYADQYLQERGMVAMTLVPSSASLHRFFDTTGMEECFGVRKVELLSSVLPEAPANGTITPISPEEYNEIRERYLKGTFHISYPDTLIDFQRKGGQLFGGDIYRLDIDGVVGCVAAEYVQKNRLLCKELLIPQDKMVASAALVASVLPAVRYHLRSPAFWDGLPSSYQQAFGMIKWYDRELHQKWFRSQDAYLGLAFD